jgi:hypothetical protein
MSKTYAIADLHGRLDLLEMALARITEHVEPPATVVTLGDYVDRGPDSRKIIERLMAGLGRDGCPSVGCASLAIWNVKGCVQKATRLYPILDEHHSEHVCRRLQRGQYPPGPFYSCSVRLCACLARRTGKAARGHYRDHREDDLCHSEHCDVDGSHWGLRCHRIHCRKVWSWFARLAGEAARRLLSNLHCVHRHCICAYCAPVRFQPVEVGKEELLICIATTSSETVLPRLIEKLEDLGCDEGVVGLVVPTGYSFNLDGTCLYLATAAVFLAQATNTPLDIWHQVGLLLILLVTSKGAAGVAGAAFVVLAATLGAESSIPVASVALILGIHRLMSQGLTPTNFLGNAVATIVMAKWEGALDEARMHRVLDERALERDLGSIAPASP